MQPALIGLDFDRRKYVDNSSVFIAAPSSIEASFTPFEINVAGRSQSNFGAGTDAQIPQPGERRPVATLRAACSRPFLSVGRKL